jgi:hypothetical protein
MRISKQRPQRVTIRPGRVLAGGSDRDRCQRQSVNARSGYVLARKPVGVQTGRYLSAVVAAAF